VSLAEWIAGAVASAFVAFAIVMLIRDRSNS